MNPTRTPASPLSTRSLRPSGGAAASLRRTMVAGGLAALTWLAGCASPGIEVKSVAIEDQSADSVKLGVDVDLTNPADESMRLLRWDYTFSANGERYSGTWEALTTLAPNSTTTRRVPVVLPAGPIGQGPWSISGSLSYRSPSRLAEIFYDLGVWRPSTGFGGAGSGAGTSGAQASAAR